jgi:hypothetical protein
MIWLGNEQVHWEVGLVGRTAATGVEKEAAFFGRNGPANAFPRFVRRVAGRYKPVAGATQLWVAGVDPG